MRNSFKNMGIVGILVLLCGSFPAFGASVFCYSNFDNSDDVIVQKQTESEYVAVSKGGQFTARALYHPVSGKNDYVELGIHEGHPTSSSPTHNAGGSFYLNGIIKPHLFFQSSTGDYMTIDCFIQ